MRPWIIRTDTSTPRVDFARLSPETRADLTAGRTDAHRPARRAVDDQIAAARMCERFGVLYDGAGNQIDPYAYSETP